MSEALAQVKRDLGRDAVILHTRNVRIGALLGIFGGRSAWEVTAAPNVNVPPRPIDGQYVSVAFGDADVDDGFSEIDADLFEPDYAGADLGVDTHPDEPAPRGPAGTAPANDGIVEQLSDIRDMLSSLVTGRSEGEGPKLPATLHELHHRLCREEVAERTATDLITDLRMALTGEELADRELVRTRLAEMIAQRIGRAPEPTAAPDARARVVALIGPTGVGKTTTVAKLAANMKLKSNMRVGLVTIDTYRIAAVDQLKTYAEIIEVPLRTVLTPQEMHQAIYAMRGMDIILIDTVGRSQNDRLRLNQLRSFLTAADADEVHLVVSATANRRCVSNVLTQFCPLGANRVIVTKLDEAEAYGMVLNVAESCKLPLSYVSAGQEVPDDIDRANPHELARLIIGGCEHAA